MPDPVPAAPAAEPVTQPNPAGAANMPPVVTPFYLDKGLWVAVLTPIIALLNQKFGLTLDPVGLAVIILPFVTYIVMHKWKTGTVMAAQAAGAAAAKAPGQNLSA